MNHLSQPTARRALVLGGGGSTGNAWLLGVVAGLVEAGLDVTPADLTIGTSAGATAAVQFATASPSELFEAALAPVPARMIASPAPGFAPARQVTDHLDRLTAIIAASADAADMRRRVGAAALERAAASDGAAQERWRATVAARLPGASWPERAVLITAVDGETGEGMAFDRDSGVDIIDAVAASTSSGIPFAIDGRSYVDGGYRRNENADLATGFDRVLVLTPFGGRSLHPKEWGTALATQVDELRASGSTVATLGPAAESEHLFGANAMNIAQRPAAAQAGYELGRESADEVAKLWQ